MRACVCEGFYVPERRRRHFVCQTWHGKQEESGRKCVFTTWLNSKPENCNLRYEFITRPLINRHNVMQQRPLASARRSVRGALTAPCSPEPRCFYLRCHKARLLLLVCGRGGFAPSSPESVRWMLSLTAVVWGPAQAATVTRPFVGILVPSHSVSETRRKVFKLDLENKKRNITASVALQLSTAPTCWHLRFVWWTRADAGWCLMWAINMITRCHCFNSWLINISTVWMTSNTSSFQVPAYAFVRFYARVHRCAHVLCRVRALRVCVCVCVFGGLLDGKLPWRKHKLDWKVKWCMARKTN